MTKATTKAQKRRRRRQRKAEEHALTRDPYAIAPVPRKGADGRKVRERDSADRMPLVKRASMAERPVTAETIREMRAPWYGCHAGRAVAGHSDVDRLWGAICHIRRTIAAYDRAIGAPNRHAQCLRLLVPIDAMQADAASPPIDVRTDEEKYRQAIAAWARLKGWLSGVDYPAASHCIAAVVDDQPVIDSDGLIAALSVVADGMDGIDKAANPR